MTMTQAQLLQFCRDYECETLSEVLLAVAESSRHCTSEAGGRIPTWPLKEAASRLSEMDAENKRLKSEVEFLHLRRGQLVIERDKAREALNETIIDLNVYSDIGIIRARTIERRAALEHQQKGEKL